MLPIITRQVNQSRYDEFCKELMRYAHRDPLEVSYTVGVTINGAEYAVKLQPERPNKLAILQACRAESGVDGAKFALITEGNLLVSLLEILIYQGVAR